MRFLAARLGAMLVTLLLVSMAVFVIADLLPGDVGRTILGPYASPEQVARLNAELGADQPVVTRYTRWIGDFITGDWGKSYLFDQEVLPLVLERLRNSVYLGGFAALIVVPISVAFGVLAALHGGRFLDRLISVVGLSLIGIPEFVAGIVLLVVFAVQLQWFDVISEVPRTLNPVDWWREFLLPSLPLMFVLFGYIARMARAGTLEALRANYTRTAVLKGVPRPAVILRHVLRNAMIPTISVIAVQVGGLVGGLVVVETVFSYPGLGQLLLRSATGHDLPVLTAVILVTALIYMVANMLADLSYVLLNPRIRGRRATA
ncbi:MAG TPA: ABC transporter permease [Kiloniellales bacterium]|nr:ABC transporter permease [Kiloniellales bacterium]